MIKEKYILKSNRLYNCSTPIVAITGGIATGKSYITDIISKLGLPTISADQQIKIIYQEEKTKDIIKGLAPKSIDQDGSINFSVLRENYFSQPKLKESLNSHIYPRLSERVYDFSSSFAQTQEIYYEVPLLFEKGLSAMVDITVLVFSSKDEQIKRIKSRDGSSDEVIQKILSHQLPIEEKRLLSHWVVDNNTHEIDHKSLQEQVEDILEEIHQ